MYYGRPRGAAIKFEGLRRTPSTFMRHFLIVSFWRLSGRTIDSESTCRAQRRVPSHAAQARYSAQAWEWRSEGELTAADPAKRLQLCRRLVCVGRSRTNAVMLGASFGSELETATLHGTCARDASAVRFNQALHGGQAARRVRQTHHCKSHPRKLTQRKLTPKFHPPGLCSLLFL